MSTFVTPARLATSTIPIVFASHADPVGLGHVASLARPGGNITGLSMLLTELAVKELEILKEAVPQDFRFGVVWNPTTPSHVPALTKNISAFRGKVNYEDVRVQRKYPNRRAETYRSSERSRQCIGDEQGEACKHTRPRWCPCQYLRLRYASSPPLGWPG